MYYVGSHWGSVDDGYVCSSPWMKRAYRRRPHDFKRRVLKYFDTRGAMVDEENRLLSSIRDEELGVKYYNLNNTAWELWHHRPDSNKKVGERISETNRGRDLIGKERRAELNIGAKISAGKKGQTFTEEHKAALREAAKTRKPQSEEANLKRAESLRKAHAEGRHAGMRGKKWDEIATPERLAAKAAATSEGLKKRAQRLREETGKGLSEDHIRKIKDSGFGQHWKGKTRSPETIERMAAARRAYWERRRVQPG